MRERGQGAAAGGGRGRAPDRAAGPSSEAAAAGPGYGTAPDGTAGPSSGDAVPSPGADARVAGAAGEACACGGGEPAPDPRSFRGDLRRGLRAGLVTFWDLVKMMVPAYFLALLLERLGVIDVLARGAEPVMSLLGLPGEAAVPLVVGYVLNVYAALGAMQALSLSAQQVTVLAIAVLIGHNLLVEGVVLQRAGMNGVAFGVLRILAGLAAAGIANLLMGML